jgi:ferredoxin-thioredoxin reductase catalytic subunit
MDLSELKLDNLEKTFEFEKTCRIIDELSEEDAKEMAKCYCKLYYKQQEMVSSFGIKSLSKELEEL